MPDTRFKTDLEYLNKLMKFAKFGRRPHEELNSYIEPDLQEENTKIFRLPGFGDMFKFSPEIPVVEEFQNPPGLDALNLNAIGKVIGTKSNDETLAALNKVNDLLSTWAFLTDDQIMF